MTAISHEPLAGRRRFSWFAVTELWASAAIIVIWLSVLFDAVFGPNITSTTAGGTSSSVPSAVAVALFAALATWPVAKYGYRSRSSE